MAWESGLVGGWSNPADPNVGDWTLGYVAASAMPDVLVGAVAAAAGEYFNFFPLVAPVTLQVNVNRIEINETESGGYIRVPARLRRL